MDHPEAALVLLFLQVGVTLRALHGDQSQHKCRSECVAEVKQTTVQASPTVLSVLLVGSWESELQLSLGSEKMCVCVVVGWVEIRKKATRLKKRKN